MSFLTIYLQYKVMQTKNQMHKLLQIDLKIEHEVFFKQHMYLFYSVNNHIQYIKNVIMLDWVAHLFMLDIISFHHYNTN